MPDTNTVTVSPQELADQATARANKLISITVATADMDLDEHELKIVSLGIDLGVSAYMAVLKAQASPECAVSAEDTRRYRPVIERALDQQHHV